MPRTGLTAEQITKKAIEATEARIRRHGFEKVRLLDIAADLGVSHVALYNHFPDKSALLDSVSEKWLSTIDNALEQICKEKGTASQLIVDWFLKLHQMKREKALTDRELYKAFNMAAEENKPFVIRHLIVMNSQLTELVRRALKKKEIRGGSAKKITELLLESTMAFHHPRLVLENIKTKRETLLKRTLEAVLKGLS